MSRQIRGEFMLVDSDQMNAVRFELCPICQALVPVHTPQWPFDQARLEHDGWHAEMEEKHG